MTKQNEKPIIKILKKLRIIEDARELSEQEKEAFKKDQDRRVIVYVVAILIYSVVVTMLDMNNIKSLVLRMILSLIILIPTFYFVNKISLIWKKKR